MPELSETNAMMMCFAQTETPLEDQRRESEREMVGLIQAGDQAAFRCLVHRYQSKVFSVIHRILRNREDTEDVAQQVFTKVYFAINSFDCRCSLLTWICKIATNECYTLLRKQRMKLAHETDAPDYEGFATESCFGANPEPAADAATVARDFLNKLLERIPEADRLLLILKEVEG